MRERGLHVWRCLWNGVEHAGELLNHNRLVGALFILTLLGFAGVVTAVWGFVGKVPCTILFTVLPLWLIVDGSYIELRKAASAQPVQAPSRLDHLRPDIIAPYIGELTRLPAGRFEPSFAASEEEAIEVANRLMDLLVGVGWECTDQVSGGLEISDRILRGIGITHDVGDQSAPGLIRFLRAVGLEVEVAERVPQVTRQQIGIFVRPSRG